MRQNMRQYQCPRSHLYYAPVGDDSGCPVCNEPTGELTRTRVIWGHGAADPEATALPGARPGARPEEPAATRLPPGPAGAQPTVGVYAALGMQGEPVVAWLACVRGPERGHDWRLVSGRNTIGRGEGMAVRLTSDPTVSRERHAVISFDPRRASFTLAPGDGTALVYHNGHEVAVPVPLAAFDRIELGESLLLFVPLVGERFAWDSP